MQAGQRGLLVTGIGVAGVEVLLIVVAQNAGVGAALWTAALGGFIACMAAVYFFGGRRDEDVGSAVVALNRMAEGDFSSVQGKDAAQESSPLMQAVSRLADALHNKSSGACQHAQQLSDEAAALADEASRSNDTVKQQELQVSSLVTAINQMSASVQEVARSASQAAEAAETANREATTGKQVVLGTIESIAAVSDEVTRVSAAIQELAANSESISSVVDVINGIAEQTNLLALNAAIEAARAGEQGRGFAVVADEVRSLAQRTQESTNEIQQTVDRLQKGAQEAVAAMDAQRAKVDDTVESAAKAGELLETINVSVATITDMNSQIASAAEQQNATTEEINENIDRINNDSATAAAAAEATEARSKHISELATSLSEILSACHR